MSTTTTITQDHMVIKIEDSPEPEASVPLIAVTSITNAPTQQPFDPKDPEGFLKRCSGYNKKKGVRCSAVIGRNSHHAKNSHSTFLPTCYAHKDQQSFAGWCQFMQKDGERCGRLFRWTPPYLELCTEHQGHPDTPCYFMKLPLELRLEVFRYLLPAKPIASSTSLLHVDEEEEQAPGWLCLYTPQMQPTPGHSRSIARRGHVPALERSTSCSMFQVPLLGLLLVSRQMHAEVKDLLYSTVPFTIDVRKDGTFMCGRRLLEPRRADGSSHFVANEVDRMKEKFLNTFDWAAVKNYNVDILVENWNDDTNRGYHTSPWDEEVEIYDIRDYIGVVVSGILSKSRNLCKLNVRLGFSKFGWDQEQLLGNIKTLVGPFERLRNVRQPRLCGVYEGTPHTNFMISLPLPSQIGTYGPSGPNQPSRMPTPICSVPQLPTSNLLLITTDPAFQEYCKNWERWISSSSSCSLVHKPPIRAMFTEFKEFYARLAAIVPEVMARSGRHAFLHQARVAREQEDIEAFRILRNELIGYWYGYLEQEERKKKDINTRLSRMLDLDVYPSSFDEESRDSRKASGSPSALGANKQALVISDKDTTIKEDNSSSGLDDQRLLLRQAQQAMAQRQQQAQAPMTQSVGCSMQVQASSSKGILQPAQCQQAMTLNPASPRQQQLRAMAQAQAQQFAMRQRQVVAARNAYISGVPQPQSIAMPTMPMQQQLSPISSSASSPAKHSPTSDIGAQNQSGIPLSLNPQPPQRLSSDDFESILFFDKPLDFSDFGVGNSTDTCGFVETMLQSSVHGETAKKRSSPEVSDVMETKKRRVDSGMGWVDGDVREVNENGDEVMVIDDDPDPFKHWAQPESEHVGKGKGKAKEVEIVCLD